MSAKIMGMVFELPIAADEKLVLLAYADNADQDGGNIWPAILTIGKKTSYSRRSVQYITRRLEKMGLLVPDGEGMHGTHRWKIPLDEGGAKIAPVQTTEGVQPIARGGCNLRQKGVQPIAPKPSLTIIKPSSEKSEKIIEKANKTVDFILETELKAQSFWPGREKIPEPIRELLDVYVELTGQHPGKAKLLDWLSTGQEWLELSIISDDLRRAYEKANPQNGKGGFTVCRPGSLTATAGAFAGERHKHQASPIYDPMASLNSYLEEQGK